MPVQFKERWLLIVAAALVTTLLAATTLVAARQFEHRLDAVRHTVDVQRQVLTVLSALQDAETGQRGYLLTGRAVYLGPYQDAGQRVGRELDVLRRLTADNPTQRQAIAELRPLVIAKLAELDQTIDLRRSGDIDGALAVVQRDKGRETMDRLRAGLAEMADREEALMRQRTAESRTLNTGFSLAFLGLVLAILGGLFTWLIQARRDGRALVEANENLRQEANERAAAEDQVRQLQKMEAIGQLTGGIAHDFNNMLAVIIGNIELGRRYLADPARADSRLANALDAASRAATLTSRLLAFSRRQALEPQALDLNRLVSGLSDMLTRTLGENIEVETVLSGGLWRTHADPAQVESAIVNLVVNARDAMSGGGRLTIETANAFLDDAYAARVVDTKAGQYVAISVSDTGHGMDADTAARAFEPFFTTKAVGKGTGLGLSQIYGFAKQTGGHARIYSEPGRGTTVKLYLPRDYSGEAAPSIETLRSDAPVPTGKPDELILVVEDEESLRKVSVENLRALGYTVRHAPNGHKAIELIRELGSVDLLFTDIIMPGMNGRQLADAASQIQPDLKVLYTTGYTQNAVVHNGVLDPGVALLQKPFTADQLAVKVRTVMGEASA